MTQEKKQTAVELFIERITKYYDKDFSNFYKAEIEQALAIEKEQIKDSWHDGNILGRNGWVQEEYSDSEGYYNHTFIKK